MAHCMTIFQPGIPDVLTLTDAAAPEPAAGQVLIRNRAAGVNFVDTIIRRGALPPETMPSLPHVPGVEGSGTVQAIGRGVTSVSPGDEVAWMGPIGAGGYGSHSLVREMCVVKLPDGTDPYEMAALPVNAITAWHMLLNIARLTERSTILVHGAAGGVGTMAVQIAKHLGATVIGSASTPKLAYVRKQGADHVIDYRKEDVAERAMSITHGRGVDLSLNPLGGSTTISDLRILAPGGTLVLFGFLGGTPDGTIADLGVHFRKSIGVRVSDIYTYFQERPESFNTDLAKIVTLCAKGILKPHIDQVFPLSQAPRAHELLESREVKGKLVLSID